MLATHDGDDDVASQILWLEWGRLTRFVESTRLAFARERTLWSSLELRAAHDDVELIAPAGQGVYRVSLKAHLETIDHEETLFASVLIHTYALSEAAAARRLGLNRNTGGIEAWGQKLLSARGSEPADVRGGEPGAVEAAVIRDAFAHGTRTVDQTAAARLVRVGAPARPAGSTVQISYDALRLYRDRLRSLLRVSGFNSSEAAGRGTP